MIKIWLELWLAVYRRTEIRHLYIYDRIRSYFTHYSCFLYSQTSKYEHNLSTVFNSCISFVYFPWTWKMSVKSVCEYVPVNFMDFMHLFKTDSWKQRRQLLLRFLVPMLRCHLLVWAMSMTRCGRTITSRTQRNAERRKGTNVMTTTAKIGNVMLVLKLNDLPAARI